MTTEKVYHYKCEVNRITHMKTGAFAFIVIMSAAFLLTGTYSCRSISDMAVFVSWIVYLVPLIGCWRGLLTLRKLDGEMTEKQHKKGPVRIQQNGGIAMLIAAGSLFCVIYFMITGEYESLAVEMGIVIRVLVQFAAALCLTLLSHHHLKQLEV